MTPQLDQCYRKDPSLVAREIAGGVILVPIRRHVGDLAEGEGGVITVTATRNPAFTGLLTNSATIATGAAESALENNVAQVTTEVAPHTVYLPVVTRQVE